MFVLSNGSPVVTVFQALAQDQRAALEQLIVSCPGLEHLKVRGFSPPQPPAITRLQIATYDGDTPQEHRAGQEHRNIPSYRLLTCTYRYPGNGFRDFHEFRAFSRVHLCFVNRFQGHDTRLDPSPRRSLENVFEELERAFQLLQANIR